MTKAKDLLQFAGSCDDLDIEKSQKDWKTMNNPFLDNRPLTDETLKELGFYNGKLMIGNVLLLQCENKDNIWVQIYDQRLSVVNKEQLDNMIFYQSNRWKTVGSVRMLIEALKGDE